MTRFLLTLDEAVDTVFAVIRDGGPGETYVPRAKSALIVHVATALIGDRPIDQVVLGIRPGEKIHEIMVSEDETYRTVERGRWYSILPMLPEVGVRDQVGGCLHTEYSSMHNTMSLQETIALLQARGLMPQDSEPQEVELLR
jgi:FlaA1/EpsC-like NDP-sugar epimerase